MTNQLNYNLIQIKDQTKDVNKTLIIIKTKNVLKTVFIHRIRFELKIEIFLNFQIIVTLFE